MVWIIITIIVIVVVVVVKLLEIGLLSYNKAKKERFLKDNPGAFPELGVLSSWLVFPKWNYEMDTILVSYETGKIYLGGKIFNILDITKLDSKEHNGYTTTTYDDKTYIKTNTGSAIGRAVLGGAIAGGIGAVVGASTANREVKTEKVAKKHYVDKSYGLYIEVNNVHEIVYISTKSKRDSDDVVAFIKDEILSYKKYLKEKQEIQRLKEKEDAKKFANAINKEINRFIQSPFDYSVDQLKIIDPQTQIFKNHCFLSDNFIKIFAEAIGISGIHLFEFGRKIFLCSKTIICGHAINDYIKYKDYLTSLFGNPLSQSDNETIKTLISNKEHIVIKWEKNGCAKLSAYYNYTDKTYNCTIEMYRNQNKSENVRANNEGTTNDNGKSNNLQIDYYFEEAAHTVVISQQCSISMIMRRFFNDSSIANRLMDQLEAAGIIGPAIGSNPREVLVEDENTLNMLIAKFKSKTNI